MVLAMFLLGRRVLAQFRNGNNFDYYDRLTTRDSSLSCSIESIIAAEVGEMDKAFSYSIEAGLMDLADVAGNVQDGCHIASMGGFWMTLIYGFAGMRDFRGAIKFSPRVPEALGRLRFPLEIRGQRLDVEMTPDEATYTLTGDTPLVIVHEGETLELAPGVPVTRPTASGAGSRPAAPLASAPRSAAAQVARSGSERSRPA